MNRACLVLGSMLLWGAMAHAQVKVGEPWVRATVAQQSATGAFMQLQSPQAARLVKVTSPVAGVVEVHEMSMEGNVMKMRALPNGLDLPAGKMVELRPGSYHIMLMDLKKTLQTGDSVPLTLTVESKDKKQETIELQAPVKAGAVRPMNPDAGKMDAHKHH